MENLISRDVKYRRILFPTKKKKLCVEQSELPDIYFYSLALDIFGNNSLIISEDRVAIS